MVRPVRSILMLLLACTSLIAVGVIWIGYPMLMMLLALALGRRGREARSRAPALRDADRPHARVSVVVATVDDDQVVRERVRDILAADYPGDRLEVVVALDARRPGSADSLHFSDARVVVVRGGGAGGKAANLNAGVAASTGELLVFTDAAQRFDRSAIERLVAALDDERLAAVSGALHIGRDGRSVTVAESYWRLERWLRGVEARVHSPVGVTGAVWALRRSCWEPLPEGLILDDLYSPMRLVLAGYRVGFEPRAVAYDERRFLPAQEFKRKVRTLTGVLQLVAWLPGVLLPWRNPIWLQFVFHKLLRLCTPYLLLVGVMAGLAGIALRVTAGDASGIAGFGLALVALSVVFVFSVPTLRRAMVMATAMQAAVVRATLNGLRGRWDVWSR